MTGLKQDNTLSLSVFNSVLEKVLNGAQMDDYGIRYWYKRNWYISGLVDDQHIISNDKENLVQNIAAPTNEAKIVALDG